MLSMFCADFLDEIYAYALDFIDAVNDTDN